MTDEMWSITSHGRINEDSDERHTVRLPDGSSATLDPEARVELQLNADQRGFVLVDGGALFHAAYTPDQPLWVGAGCVRMYAVEGTFRAWLSSDGQVLTVHTHSCGLDVLMDPQAKGGAVDESRARRETLDPYHLAEIHLGGEWIKVNPRPCMPDEPNRQGLLI